MTKSRSAARPERAKPHSSVKVRLDEESKDYLVRAASLRRVSLSDYVREVAVAQARKEVFAAREQTIVLTPDEQLAFWKALHGRVRLTEKQRRLGAFMRGVQ